MFERWVRADTVSLAKLLQGNMSVRGWVLSLYAEDALCGLSVDDAEATVNRILAALRLESDERHEYW